LSTSALIDESRVERVDLVRIGASSRSVRGSSLSVTASNTRRTAGASRATRALSISSSESGSGKSSASAPASPSSNARPTSSANSGFPPVASTICDAVESVREERHRLADLVAEIDQAAERRLRAGCERWA
jgi:hypothetical protein